MLARMIILKVSTKNEDRGSEMRIDERQAFNFDGLPLPLTLAQKDFVDSLDTKEWKAIPEELLDGEINQNFYLEAKKEVGMK